MDDIKNANEFLAKITSNPDEINTLIETRISDELLARIDEYSSNVCKNVGEFSVIQIISTSMVIGYLLKTYLYRKEIEENMKG